ncbi:hypothetical protein [Methylobacterium oxalidis]|uniref:Uncharacterized protein n=1 Tax=Methylobacterium oxalidis TaxID=944322 RepID=A0A512J9Y5_9HYPH|nr:hypothetical protein [Methylobacterium oxalidis]GEP06774.1 hypothetical protein MOX02_48120 [Methylobacterium oxalidis]GLS67982.1 hypothetical protein GCM10007888_63670 [Methylobacterium oxalidis]
MTEAAAAPKKRMGRPPKAPEKGRRQNYTFRMSDADRDRIIDAAARSGRSMSEEIERRIERSLANDEDRDTFGIYIDTSADALFGGRHNLSLFVSLSDYIFVSERHTKNRWNKDAETKKIVLEYLLKTLPLAMNQAEKANLSFTSHLKERERRLDEIRSRIAHDDEQENVGNKEQ